MSLTGPLFKHRTSQGTHLITSKGGATIFRNSGTSLFRPTEAIFSAVWEDKTDLEKLAGKLMESHDKSGFAVDNKDAMIKAEEIIKEAPPAKSDSVLPKVDPSVKGEDAIKLSEPPQQVSVPVEESKEVT